MKLLRHGPEGQEKPGIVDGEGVMHDLSGEVSDITGAILDKASLEHIRNLNLEKLPEVDASTRLGPCVGNIGKLICVGLNYTDHATETGHPIPTEPVLFSKAISCVCGPNDQIERPVGSSKLDWEAELGIVISKETKNISETVALEHIAGYCIVNDVSERTFQIEHQGQWMKGKSSDTFGPVGPWLVTCDEIPSTQALNIWLEVNGERRQDGNTSNMIFSVPFVVSYVSRFMSLQPGDIISTGTPAGVGMGMKPPTFLNPGDVIRLGIDGLGEQQQTVVDGVA